jgi:hypothetical protein
LKFFRFNRAKLANPRWRPAEMERICRGLVSCALTVSTCL